MAATFGKRSYNTVSHERKSRSEANLQAEPSVSSADIGNLLSNVGSWLFSFNGRATRLEWWCLFALAMALLSPFFAMDMQSPPVESQETASVSTAILFFVMFIAVAWSNIAVSVRRYHDRGKSGWWYFVYLIPIIGIFWQIVELGFLPGEESSNKYG